MNSVHSTSTCFSWHSGLPHKPRLAAAAARRGQAGIRALTAISASGERTDLVTIPPHTSEQAASVAMRQATKAGNREHAPAILAAISATADEVPASAKGDE